MGNLSCARLGFANLIQRDTAKSTRSNRMLYHLSKITFSFTASALQQIFGLHSRLAIQQWSLVPDTKICAASLKN